MHKLRRIIYTCIASILIIILLLIGFLNSPLNSSYEETGIDGSKRYYELLNKHPRSHEEYEEFLEEEEKYNKKISEFYKKIKSMGSE